MARKFRAHSWAQGMIPNGSVCVEKKPEKNFTQTYIFKKLCSEIKLLFTSFLKKMPCLFQILLFYNF